MILHGFSATKNLHFSRGTIFGCARMSQRFAASLIDRGWLIDESKDPAYPQNQDLHFKARLSSSGSADLRQDGSRDELWMWIIVNRYSGDQFLKRPKPMKKSMKINAGSARANLKKHADLKPRILTLCLSLKHRALFSFRKSARASNSPHPQGGLLGSAFNLR